MRKLYFTLVSLLIVFLALLLNHCSPGKGRRMERHISDSLFTVLNDRYHSVPEALSRKSVDSLFRTFPYLSPIDQYRYFEFRRNIYFDAHLTDPHLGDTSLFYTDRMIEALEEAGATKLFEREYVEALQKKSSLFTESRRYEEAVDLLARCTLLNQESGNLDMVCENICASAYIAYYQRKYDIAIERFHQALALTKYHKTPGMLFFRTQRTLDDLGILFRAAGNNDSALYWHFKAVAFIQSSLQTSEESAKKNAYGSLQNTYENIAQIYLEMDSISKARQYIDSALKIGEHYLTDSGELYRLYQTSASVLFAEKKLDEADRLNTKAREKFTALSSSYKIKLLALQEKIDSMKGRDKSRAANLYQLYRLKDSVNTDVIEALKKDPQAVYEQLAKKHQIELLENKNKLQSLYLTGALLIAALLVVMAIIIFRNLKRSKRLNESLYRREQELRRLLEEIAEQKEKEKRQEMFFQQLRMQEQFSIMIKQQKQKISDDMHDELTSSLAALKYYLNDLAAGSKDTATQKMLAGLEEEVATIYASTRQYMHNLRNQSKQNDYNLPEFLNEISQKFREKGLMEITVSLEEEKLLRLLSKEQYENFYFIIKEALSNIIKHSKAKNASISVSFTETDCCFLVLDDGKGATHSTIKYGLGLNSIKSRIQYLRGQVSFRYEQGMIMEGCFPLEQSEEEPPGEWFDNI